ncbi:MAG TPA: aldose 1-epimerase family protein [Propionibacteriaceae bacterium]|nr:aldose 1-epimerase family protein [Propionibacteriaceae bacterium]
MSIPPTGEQYEIVSGGHRAVVTEVGATLRSYSVDGVNVVRGFGEHESPRGGQGQNLLPWPNRIRDGKYTFAGKSQQLWLSEPARHNASHGLVRYVPWVLVDRTPDSVTNRVRVFPQPGWPGWLEATVTHAVSTEGLTVTMSATNIGDGDVPFGYAAHPYLTVGEETVDDVDVRVPAAAYLEVDPDRLLPIRVAPVDGTDLDLRDGTTLGSRNLDSALTDLARDADGRWRVTLTRGDRTAELWGDESMAWVQVFTGGPYRDRSVAVEPMTCGPDAYNEGPTHDDLIVLAPGDTCTGRWGVRGA